MEVNSDNESYESGSEMDNDSYSSADDSSFEYLDGRRFNKKYHLPADDDEVTREQMQHYLMRYAWQTNFSAPVEELLKKGAKVLDMGCGPGTWLLEMASQYSNSKFMGVDISEVFPMNCMPRNAEFQKADILENLPFDDNSFDYVFVRFLTTAFPQDKWKSQVIPELTRVTKPGGWIELMESDCRLIKEGPSTNKLITAFLNALESKSINGRVANLLPEFLSSTPGIDKSSVSCQIKEGPIGIWGGKAGILSVESACHTFKSLKTLITRCNPNLDEKTYYGWVSDLEKEVDEYQTSWSNSRIFARKSL